MSKSVASVRLVGSTVTGSLQLQGTTGAGDLMSSGANVICNSKVNGNLQIQSSGAGSPWHIGGCGSVTVGGNFQFQSNAGTGNSISMTTVNGNLQCQSNHDVSGTGNTVAGIRQCPGVA